MPPMHMKILMLAWKQYPGAMEVWLNSADTDHAPIAIKTKNGCYTGYARQHTTADNWGLRARSDMEAWLHDWDAYEWRGYCVEWLKKSVADEPKVYYKPRQAAFTLPEFTIRTASDGQFVRYVPVNSGVEYYITPEWGDGEELGAW
jgi:hypothetical protein